MLPKVNCKVAAWLHLQTNQQTAETVANVN